MNNQYLSVKSGIVTEGLVMHNSLDAKTIKARKRMAMLIRVVDQTGFLLYVTIDNVTIKPSMKEVYKRYLKVAKFNLVIYHSLSKSNYHIP
jgi:hypothetical protein